MKMLPFAPAMVRASAIAVAALLLPAAAQAAPPAPAAKPASFAMCAVCHVTKAGQKSTIGPNLAGVSGRKAGTLPGYAFSDAMKKSGIVWNKQTMAAYLANPRAKVPGTKMAFAGQKDPKKLDELVAYVLSLR